MPTWILIFSILFESFALLVCLRGASLYFWASIPKTRDGKILLSAVFCFIVLEFIFLLSEILIVEFTGGFSFRPFYNSDTDLPLPPAESFLGYLTLGLFAGAIPGCFACLFSIFAGNVINRKYGNPPPKSKVSEMDSYGATAMAFAFPLAYSFMYGLIFLHASSVLTITM